MAPEEMPPDEPGRYEAEKKSTRHNPVMFGFGIALTSLGGASILIGLFSTFILAAWTDSKGDAYAGPVVAIAGGAVVTVAGIPMIVIGGRKRGPNTQTSPIGNAPAWLGAPHGAGWAWTF